MVRGFRRPVSGGGVEVEDRVLQAAIVVGVGM